MLEGALTWEISCLSGSFLEMQRLRNILFQDLAEAEIMLWNVSILKWGLESALGSLSPSESEVKRKNASPQWLDDNSPEAHSLENSLWELGTLGESAGDPLLPSLLSLLCPLPEVVSLWEVGPSLCSCMPPLKKMEGSSPMCFVPVLLRQSEPVSPAPWQCPDEETDVRIPSLLVLLDASRDALWAPSSLVPE